MSRVLIVDDHAVIRRGVQWILSAFPEFELCGEAADGQEAVRLAQALKPDYIIMDMSMPTLNGLDATRMIREAQPEVKVLMLTLHSSVELVRNAFRVGARAFVLKSDAEHQLVRALHAIADEGIYVSPGIDGSVAQNAAREAKSQLDACA